ncbi:hypothetical protein DERF_010171 [Dermatophagoides farinae]|uniref:Uncharacterized protein n=1 Tax=Dermatophagoides farinae TaxID=6954 RepID=A0A922L2A2_DERFA|nr:hypothetical protein DERF_010171 [Dermatophagoides farinae]
MKPASAPAPTYFDDLIPGLSEPLETGSQEMKQKKPYITIESIETTNKKPKSILSIHWLQSPTNFK